MNFIKRYVIIDTYRILFYQIPKSLTAFCGQMTAVSIDGVAKMPLQASIFTPGKMNSRASILCLNYIMNSSKGDSAENSGIKAVQRCTINTYSTYKGD